MPGSAPRWANRRGSSRSNTALWSSAWETRTPTWRASSSPIQNTRLTEPSIYDESLALLARRGLPIPQDKLTRDFALPYVADDRVTEAWRLVYRDVDKHWDLYELAEKLVDLEYRFHLWRFSHMKTVERIIGNKPGTGGTSGVNYLKKALDLTFYPELWAVRGEI
jgi:tryptophan 2,3-dioxygenase